MSCARKLCCAAALLLGGCAAEQPRVHEYLDPQTAVTIRTLAAPLMFAHEAPELAANARDYLSLGVVEVDNMGARRHYLALVSWSTINRAHLGAASAPVPERIELTLGGQPRELAPVSHEPRSLGIGGTPFRPASGYVGEAWYAVTPAELRALAAAPAGPIVLLADGVRVTYGWWRGDEAALREFVRDIPGNAGTGPARR
ncbi:MAG TPA: hypothetical protein VMU00_13715 [Steroidobacteraceae bacterium]|nr:hypothetical protein [Steroidobacteraceae bacterium]